jgi:UDP-N-acetylmuramyl pentapeptide phosphotransferase/UDP-N-acetylglucosamine-1-phosphate transferase
VNAELVAAAIVPALVAWIVIRVALGTGYAMRAADRPNERSLHDAPRPRVGGIGVMLAALPWAVWHAPGPLQVIAGCAAALALVSALDDLKSLPAAVRLAAHLAAAAIAVIALVPGAHWPLAVSAAVVLAIAWMANLYNFMDGADGLAGGMAVIGNGACAIAAAQAGFPALAIACAALASAAAGFLAWNFPPARVFLGDAGSIPLGFLAGALGLAGYLAGAWPAWFPVLVFSPFIVDATVTFLRRAARREPVWRAHRSHWYQRLVLAGWPHRRTALAAYGLMLAAAASALVARPAGGLVQCAMMAVWVAAWSALAWTIERHLRRAGQGGVAPTGPGRSID